MEQKLKEDRALTSFMPHLPAYLEMLGIEKYVERVPIVSVASWKAYLGLLPTYCGSGTGVASASVRGHWVKAKL